MSPKEVEGKRSNSNNNSWIDHLLAGLVLILIIGLVFIAAGIIFFPNYLLSQYELSKYYGINVIYLYFRYTNTNLLSSLVCLLISAIILLVFIKLSLEESSSEEKRTKPVKFLIFTLMLICSSSIIGCLHSINYYGFNANYKISDHVSRLQYDRDSEKYKSSRQKISHQLNAVNEIINYFSNSSIEKFNVDYQGKYDYGILRPKKYNYRYDIHTKSSKLKAYFRQFPVNRSLRFDYTNSLGNEFNFLLTIPNEYKGISDVNTKDSLNFLEVLNFYNSFNYAKQDVVLKKDIINTLNAIKLDFNIARDILRNQEKELSEIGISWDLFVSDTIFRSFSMSQGYFKSDISFLSRSLILFHGIILLAFIRLFLPIIVNKEK